MILSDNETKNDLLNNSAIASTIVAMINESPNQPLSIGIHGDWGAGKSSILEMVYDQIANSPKEGKTQYSCIRFNGWKHQGFEDSKIALMSAIISEIEQNVKLTAKAKEIVKKLWKNINWLSVAKTAGKIGVGIATGTTPMALLSVAIDKLKKNSKDEAEVATAIDTISSYLNEAGVIGDNSSNHEFAEFQKNFTDLLNKTKIDKLVVLIDDLDRCLPDVVIDTLEAIRLFMFNEKTAFIIAADEIMVQYAVKKHFPDVIDIYQNNAGKEFANKYLEKLIQVPFKIPALGDIEARNYIMLLLVGSRLEDDNRHYQALCKESINRMKKPWDIKPFGANDVFSILQEDYSTVQTEVSIAIQISNLLASNTNGNPRKIKRFINMLLLRYAIASSRGYSDAIKLPILAKMMLVEHYSPAFYKNLPNRLDENGVWKEFSEIKNSLSSPTEEKNDDIWFDIKEMSEWILSEPSIEGVNLKPYYFACKERIDYFAGRKEANDLGEIVDLLFSNEMLITQHKEKIERLTEEEALQIFEVVTTKINQSGQFNTKPNGIDGLIILVQSKPDLHKKLADFISTIPPKEIGVWVLTGFDKAIPKDSEAWKVLEKYRQSLMNDGSELVKKALRRLGEK